MATTTKLDKDEQGKNVDIKLYRSMIGSFLYLTASRTHIMLSIFLCATFQSYPKESHLVAVKHIIKYLKDTIGMLVVSENQTIFYDELFRCRLCRL